MVITPSSYDPFNNVSFVQLNKQKRGELDRQPTSQRIYNNFYSPQTVRINIIRNGDVNSRPKLFIWRKWKGGHLSDLLEEAGRHLDYEPSRVYNENGEQITHASQVSGGHTYIFSGLESFDYRTVESINHLTPTKQTGLQLAVLPYKNASRKPVKLKNEFDFDREASSNSYNNPSRKPVKLKNEFDFDKEANSNSYNSPSLSRQSSKFSRKNLYDFDQEASSNPPRIYSSRLPTNVSDDYPTPKLNDDDITSYQLSTRTSQNISLHTVDPNDEYNEIANMFNDLEFRDREMIAKHRAKFAGKRSDTIFNQQNHLNSYLIYVFLNGNGNESIHMSFTKSQIDYGMSYILEAIAQKFNVAPSKLVTLDGQKVQNVYHLIFRGAYVLIPVGQNYRDILYVLPQNAIDTGSNTRNMKQHQIHKNKRFDALKLPTINNIY